MELIQVFLFSLALSLCGPSAATPPPPARTGLATYYAPGVMETVYQNRLAWEQITPCPECVGQVALRDGGDIGRKVWLRFRGVVYGPFLVVDCAAPRNRAQMDRQGRVVEMSYPWARRLGMNGPLPVEVLFGEPEPEPEPGLDYRVYLPFVPMTYTGKGLAMAWGHCEDATAVGATWEYNWYVGFDCPGLDNVPMLYNADVENWPKPGFTSDWLLGFNEPDINNQGNLTPAAAALLWREAELRYPDKFLVSPAPSHKHPEWLAEFRGAYLARYGTYPRLDALAAHCYGTLLFCREIIGKYLTWAEDWRIPGGVWVTEFANKDVAIGAELVEWLAHEPGVSRYAWFDDRQRPDEFPSLESGLFDFETGRITEAGSMYRSLSLLP